MLSYISDEKAAAEVKKLGEEIRALKARIKTFVTVHQSRLMGVKSDVAVAKLRIERCQHDIRQLTAKLNQDQVPIQDKNARRDADKERKTKEEQKPNGKNGVAALASPTRALASSNTQGSSVDINAAPRKYCRGLIKYITEIILRIDQLVPDPNFKKLESTLNDMDSLTRVHEKLDRCYYTLQAEIKQSDTMIKANKQKIDLYLETLAQQHDELRDKIQAAETQAPQGNAGSPPSSKGVGGIVKPKFPPSPNGSLAASAAAAAAGAAAQPAPAPQPASGASPSSSPALTPAKRLQAASGNGWTTNGTSTGSPAKARLNGN